MSQTRSSWPSPARRGRPTPCACWRCSPATGAGLADRFQPRVAAAEAECGIADEAGLRAGDRGDWTSVTLFTDNDRGAIPATGSRRTSGMVICPCSMGTVSAIAHGSSRSLVERAADVALKERRKLVLVPRETPLSLVHLRNLTAATEAGAVVIPAAPGFYHRPTAVGELVDFIVQRVLDQLGLEIEIAQRWQG